MVTLDNIGESIFERIDIFITSASYEERCLSITKSILKKISNAEKIVSVSLQHKILFAENLNFFIEQGFKPVEVSIKDQIFSAYNFNLALNEALTKCPDSNVLIDITTFPRQILLIITRLLRNILTTKSKVEFLYSPAKEYSVGLPYGEKWLSKGILNVNSIFGFSGVIRPSNPYHLIILMGFEVERASALINWYEPEKISIGFAKKNDSISKEYFELNLQKINSIISEFPFAQQFEFSCIKVEESKEDILVQVRKYKNYNVIISPMNNKISTLSCALAAFDNEEIQLALAQPAIYNSENYSTASNFCHVIKIEDFIKNLE